MSAAEIALLVFTACNSARILAYVPQILKIGRDAGGAQAISYWTWGLFGASHLSTVAYALLTLSDIRLAAVFLANAACCGSIVGLTFYKRRRFAERKILAPEPEASAEEARCHQVRLSALEPVRQGAPHKKSASPEAGRGELRVMVDRSRERPRA